MHLYNAWLPPPVAEESKKEKESFSWVVSSVKGSYKPNDPESVYSTLKWVSVIDLSVHPIHYIFSIFIQFYDFSMLFSSFAILCVFKFCFFDLGFVSMWLKFEITHVHNFIRVVNWLWISVSNVLHHVEVGSILAMQFCQGKKWRIFGRCNCSGWIWIGTVSCVAK